MTKQTFLEYLMNLTLGVFLALVVSCGIMLVSAQFTPNDTLPTCAYEDGNPDGKPCMWTDPSTGVHRYVDSSEYRN